MESKSISLPRRSRAAKEFLNLRIRKKTSKRIQPDLLGRANERGIHFIDPKICLKIIKKRVRADLNSKEKPPAFSEKEISGFVSAFKNIKNKKGMDDYLDLLKGFRKPADPTLEKLQEKGFPIEGIYLTKLASLKKDQNFEKFLELLKEHSSRFADASEGDVEDNARALNRLQARSERLEEMITSNPKVGIRVGVPIAIAGGALAAVPALRDMAMFLLSISGTVITTSTASKKVLEKKLAFRSIPISKEVKDLTLKDTLNVLNAAFSLPTSYFYKNRQRDGIIANLLHLKVKKDINEKFVQQMSRLWAHLGDPTPEKIERVNAFFDKLSPELQKKILSGEKCRKFFDTLGTSGLGLLESLQEESRPDREYQLIERAFSIPMELIDSIKKEKPGFLQSILERTLNGLKSDPILRTIGEFKDKKIEEIELKFERSRKSLREEEEVGEHLKDKPRLEKFGIGSNLYSVLYPKEYLDLVAQVGLHLQNIDEKLFGPLIQSIGRRIQNDRMILSACVAEKKKRLKQKMKKFVESGSSVYEVTRDLKLEPVKLNEEERRRVVSDFVYTPGGRGTHYTVIQEILDEFREGGEAMKNLSDLKEHLESLTEAKKIIERKTRGARKP